MKPNVKDFQYGAYFDEKGYRKAWEEHDLTLSLVGAFVLGVFILAIWVIGIILL